MAISVSDILCELKELGFKRSLYRCMWEVRKALGLFAGQRPSSSLPRTASVTEAFFSRIPFESPTVVATFLRDRLNAEQKVAIVGQARHAACGEIRCFGRWTAQFGNPINWCLNPVTGRLWRSDVPWFKATKQANGDVKLTWEIGRFPHAYSMARAAVLDESVRADVADSYAQQVTCFLSANPVGRGIHWNSGQEVAFRMMAWIFAGHVFRGLGLLDDATARVLVESVEEAAIYVQAHISFAENAVYNNHLLSEAAFLLIAGVLLEPAARALEWRNRGALLLTHGVEQQFYSDGGYVQHSHNYHRLALQVLLWASAFRHGAPSACAETWHRAMARSLAFLVAHQAPETGELPNYGANDGALPSILSTCDFADFRPTLQAASAISRGAKLYRPGPWDEELVWFGGVPMLDLPLMPFSTGSVSFVTSGYHVLRGRAPNTFGSFRCGSITERFSQIDMLHLDVRWRGQNVLVDPGSYLYNGCEKWHNHFFRTGSHNTVQVDGRDQMQHLRKFKCIHWTKAKLLRFEDKVDWTICEGEHYGYQRYPGNCVHRRCVLFWKDDLWVVMDRVEGTGTHSVRVHWLGGDFPYCAGVDGEPSLQLETPGGPFYLSVFDATGGPLPVEVVAGQNDPPRGWLSRYYGEKVPVPSLSVEISKPLPITTVSILGAHIPSVSVTGSTWSVVVGDRIIRFEMTADGIIQPRSLKVPLVVA